MLGVNEGCQTQSIVKFFSVGFVTWVAKTDVTPMSGRKMSWLYIDVQVEKSLDYYCLL